MSLFSALNASVSGMSAQANKLSAVSDNISNSDTTGYKQASAEFKNLVTQLSSANVSNYNAGGVSTVIRYNIQEQGNLQGTTSPTDLAVQGRGFFIVGDGDGATFLTRAGNFTQDSSGHLVNAAGFELLGYPSSSGSTIADGVDALKPINVTSNSLSATASTAGVFAANLNSNAAMVTGTLPGDNLADASYTSKSSLVTYDNLGNAVTLDMYFSKTGAGDWQASVFNSADAAPGGGFPYASAALTTKTLNFSASDGGLTIPAALSLAIPGGKTVSLDISKMTQLASSFSVSTANADGNAPSAFQSVSISADGTLSEVYANGTERVTYKIPLATAPAENLLTPLTGDVFAANTASGEILVGEAALGGLGSIKSAELEASTVDLATQLTDMIVAQRSYESNSKAFQTGSELLSQLNNMLK